MCVCERERVTEMESVGERMSKVRRKVIKKKERERESESERQPVTELLRTYRQHRSYF